MLFNSLLENVLQENILSTSDFQVWFNCCFFVNWELYWNLLASENRFQFFIFQCRFSLVSLYFDGPFNTFCCL